MRESQGGSTLLAGGAQCHFFNCQQTMSAHSNYTHALTRGLWERTLLRLTLRHLQNPLSFQDAGLCRAPHVPHILPQTNSTLLLDLDAFTADVYTSGTLYQTWGKGQDNTAEQAL